MNPTNAPPANYSLAAVTATIEGTAKNKKTPGYTAHAHSPPAGRKFVAVDLAI